MKYYAVIYKDKSNAIYTSWEQCKQYTQGYKGVVFKSFTTLEDAKNFINIKLNNSINLDKINNSLVTIYVDGSFSDKKQNYSYGIVITKNNEVIHVEGNVGKKNKEGLKSRNITGELLGTIVATKYAIIHKYNEINMVYDYQGIEEFATGTWTPKTNIAKIYQKSMNEYINKIKINFVKVKGHTNEEFNELADKIAKMVLGIN